jgi:hypothetical protein
MLPAYQHDGRANLWFVSTVLLVFDAGTIVPPSSEFVLYPSAGQASSSGIAALRTPYPWRERWSKSALFAGMKKKMWHKICGCFSRIATSNRWWPTTADQEALSRPLGRVNK